MRIPLGLTFGIALIASPAGALSPLDDGMAGRTGAFVGLRLVQPLDQRTPARPRAMLAAAPMRITSSPEGRLRSTVIGDGLALDFSAKAPQLTIAGVRADRLLGLAANGSARVDKKQNLSTGAAVAIGVGVVVVAGVLLYANYCDKKFSSLCGDSE